MYYKIFTSENLSEWNAFTAEIRNAAKSSGDYQYSQEPIAIIGEDAISRFIAEHGITIKEHQRKLKIDEKSSAELIPCLLGSYYCDTSRETVKEGLDGFFFTTEYYLIRYRGVLFEYSMLPNQQTAYISIFNDHLDYTHYLPYDWDKKNPMPNKIGVVTDKKMDVWMSYLVSRNGAASGERIQKISEKNLFLERVRCVDETKCQEVKIGEKSGYIIRNGLKFSYTIDEHFFIEQNLEVYYRVAWNDGKAQDKLAAFGLMSEGKY